MITSAPIQRKERFSKIHYPVLFKLFLLFVFFLPLRGVQIPVGVFGFEINPARVVSVLFTIFLCMSICIDARYFNRSFLCMGALVIISLHCVRNILQLNSLHKIIPIKSSAKK